MKIEEIEDNLIGRIDEEKLESIKSSIKEVGLINPITVTPDRKLIAGKKRLRACKELGWKEIPVIERVASEDVRLHENLKREHLSWHDEAVLVEKLHTSRIKEHGPSKPGRSKKSGWTLRDTAKELGRSLGIVSEAVSLVKAVEKDPSLKNIKDRQTALRLVKLRKQQTEQEEESIVTPKIEANSLYLGDASAVLKLLPKDTFHVCMTDPPWLKFAGHKKLEKDDKTLDVFRQVWRVLRKPSFLYLFIGINEFEFYLENLGQIGFFVQETPLIWHKKKFLSRRSSGSFYGRDFELIIVAAKGDPVLYTRTDPNSVFSYDIVHSSKLRHPNEKPKGLINELLGHCSVTDNLVLDPFAGSGVVGLTAKEIGRKFVMIERDRIFYEKIKARLE